MSFDDYKLCSCGHRARNNNLCNSCYNHERDCEVQRPCVLCRRTFPHGAGTKGRCGKCVTATTAKRKATNHLSRKRIATQSRQRALAMLQEAFG